MTTAFRIFTNKKMCYMAVNNFTKFIFLDIVFYQTIKTKFMHGYMQAPEHINM